MTHDVRPHSRSQRPWAHPAGNDDKLHVSHLFPTHHNQYGIPQLARALHVPPALVPFGSPRRLLSAPAGAAIHFWLDDYQFERVWSKYDLHTQRLLAQGYALSPDFSTYADWPHAVNLWQIYRNRWLARYWQGAGITVIPSVGWSNPESLEYSFLGIPPGGVIAIQTQTVRLRDAYEHELFRLGFAEMLRVLEPSTLLVYGSLARIPLLPAVEAIEYPTFWQTRRAELTPCG